MANTVNSPYMTLPIPVVGVDPGPEYATDVNSCLTVIDSHNHTPGYGVQVPSAGLDIDADLPFNNNNLVNARSLRLHVQSAPLALVTDLNELYDVNGDLYFNDGSGNQIQITASGAIAGTPGSITNMVPPASVFYNTGTKTFIFKSDSTTPANLDAGYIILRNNVSNSRGLTLFPPDSMSSDYYLKMPSLPLQLGVMTLDPAGNMSSQLVTQDLLAPKSTGTSVPLGGVAIATPSGSFTTSSTTPVMVTNQSISIDTNGRPVSVFLQPVLAAGTVDSQTVLLLHCDGSSGSTSFPDSSTYTHSVSAVGTAQVDTSFQHFGTGSLSCVTGGPGHLSTGGSADWAFGTGDFTIDFWAAKNAPATGGFISNSLSGVSNTSTYVLRYNATQDAIEWGNSGTLILQTPSGLMPGGTFVHVALVRSSGVVTLYVNGDAQASAPDTNNYSNSSNALTIGYYDLDGLTYNGNMDEIRVSKGIARWTSDFIPPTAPYGSAPQPGFIGCQAGSGSSQATFTLKRDGAVINEFSLSTPSASLNIPPGAIMYLDLAPVGTHTYELFAQTAGSTPLALVSNCQLVAYET